MTRAEDASPARASERPRGGVLWLTGPPASGKTALAGPLVDALAARGRATLWLDSDELRRVLTPAPTYSPAERDWFYGVLGHVAILAARGGVVVVVSATASRRAYRDEVRRAVGAFMEIYLQCPPETLRARDPKHLYRRAAAGEIDTLPGAGAAYEPPEHPELVLDSGRRPIAELLAAVLARLDALGI